MRRAQTGDIPPRPGPSPGGGSPASAGGGGGRAAVTEVRMEGIRKAYGRTTVLHDVSLTVRGGEVHGLIGENGAGKSTLLRALAGAVPIDAGRVVIDGQVVATGSPRAALRHGIGSISQEPTLVPTMSVLDNVLLGRWSHRGGWRSARSDRARFAQLLSRTSFHLDPDAMVRDLSLATRQRVEILRALGSGARVLAMDEPTALLSETETGQLLALVRQLADEGVAILLTSHFLDEVRRVSDMITVLRDGRHVMTGPAGEQTPDSLVRHMVGQPLELLHPAPEPVPADAPVALSVRGVGRDAAVRDVGLEVRAGEIVGIVGLVGSGRSETLRAIFGADGRDTGVVEVGGQAVRPASPAHAIEAGMAMVPESRGEQGLVPARSVRENLALPSLSMRQRAGVVRRRAEAGMAARTIDRLDVRGADLGGPVWTLSGGNQQKVLFGKWLVREPKVLLVDEPTRGVDVAAKIQIHELLIDLARQGVAVLMVSSEIDEVLGLAHRVLVLRRGRVVAEFSRGSVSQQDMAALVFEDAERPEAGAG